MRFCPQCGAPLMAGAKFCVECGRPLGAGASPASGPAQPSAQSGINQTLRNMPLTTAFVGVFVAITVVGLLAAGWIMLRTPAVVQQAASAPIGGQSVAPGSGTNSMGGTAGNAAPNQLPPGHPKVRLPTEARTFIDKVEKDAIANPKDAAAWNKLGTVAMRAAMFDDSYYAKASQAYAHVLQLDPDNLQALRGLGDIDYDTNHYDEAIAAYEHYLKKKPDDPEVRTDLGTMYLYTNNADQAIVQYNRALKIKPDMFQPYFNLAVAYAQMGNAAAAQASLKKAYSLAPDDNARNQVKEVMAKIGGASGASMLGGTGVARASAGASASPAAAPSVAAAPKTFEGAIEQLVRGLPVAGPRVGAVQWPAKTTAKVMMDNFPMDKMPPFIKQKFLGDIRTGIDSAKKNYKITGKVEVDLVDAASGRVMETVSE